MSGLRRAAALLSACLLSACLSARASHSVTSATEARAVESAIRQWYDASERKDSAAYAARMLPEFSILEDTTRYDRETILRLVVSSFTRGTDRAALSDFDTQVAGDVAWTSFRNAEIFTPIGGPPGTPRRFVESAVLRKVDGEWKLARYHATRINRPPPR